MPLFGTRGAASVTGFGGLAKLGYLLRNSLRFRASNNARLTRTPGSASNRKTYTISAWVKFGESDSTIRTIFCGGDSSTSTSTHLYIYASQIRFYFGGAGGPEWRATQLLRDPAAWYHIVAAVDTNQGTLDDKLKLYVNGTRVTSWVSQNSIGTIDTQINNTVAHALGSNAATAQYLYDGYMAEFNFIDGQQLTPSSFAKTDAVTGQWIPIKFGGAYGTNGFYLPFTGDSFAGSFNGTTQYLQATLPATLTGAFTIESYFYRLGSGNNYLFTLGDSKTSTGLEYYIGSSGAQNNIYSNDSTQINSSSNLPTINAWNHVAVTRDSSNGVRLFVNGVQVGSTWTTAAAFSSTLRIGVEFYNSALTGYINGGLSNFRVVNGTALYTSNFTPPTSALTAVSGTAILTLQNSTIIDNSDNALSITNNGTVVTNTTMLGNQSKDYSPQGNNWTNNNIGVLAGSTLDIMTDVPTLTSATAANYATLNPLAMYGTNMAISNAGLTSSATSTSNDRGWSSTIAAPGSGKWYAEFTFTATSGDNNGGCGIMLENGTGAPGESATTVSWRDAGTLRQTASGTSYGSALSVNDVVMVAYDASLGRVWFGKNGTWFASGDPATNSNPSATGITSSGRFATYHYNTVAVIQANFGQQPFQYSAPSGYKALNTYNLP